MRLNIIEYLKRTIERNMRMQIVDRFTPVWYIDRPKATYEAFGNPWGYSTTDVGAISNFILNKMEKEKGIDIRWYRHYERSDGAEAFRDWLMGEQTLFNADFTHDGAELCKMCSKLTELPVETFVNYIKYHAIDLVYDVAKLLYDSLVENDKKYCDEKEQIDLTDKFFANKGQLTAADLLPVEDSDGEKDNDIDEIDYEDTDDLDE